MNQNKKALIVVDVQNDFCPNGRLAVNEGDMIVNDINEAMLKGGYDLIVATLDWHPQNHKSFASNNDAQVFSLGTLNGQPQVMWPDHCVQNSVGAQLHPRLNSNLINYFVKKGTNPEVDSYSGFFDNDQKSATELNDILLKHGIQEVDVVGLALDYCVKFTAEDAKRLGYKTSVLADMTRAVNMTKDDDKKAIKDLKEKGIEVK